MKSSRPTLEALVAVANLALVGWPAHLSGREAEAAQLAALEREAAERFAPTPEDVADWRRWAWNLRTGREAPCAVVKLERGAVVLHTPEELRDTARGLYALLDQIVSVREAHEEHAHDAATWTTTSDGRRVFYAALGPARVSVPGTIVAHLIPPQENAPPGALRIKLEFGAVVTLLLALEELPDSRYVRRCPAPDCGRFFYAWRKDQGGCSAEHRAYLNKQRHKLRAVQRAQEQAAAQAEGE